MTNKDQLQNLIDIIKQLQEAADHLKISLLRCNQLHVSSKDENTLIEFEALTSRFARVIDILIHKVYRSIDAVEFIEGGTLIDVMNRADKRELIDSVQEMRIFKDLRNDIAHEYLGDRMQLLYKEVLESTPKLLELCYRAIDYTQRFH